MPNIALIYLYYGSWPWYFDFFIKSCSYNSEITFIIITDINPPKVYPKNMKFIFMTLRDVEKLVTAKLEFEVKLNKAYKLCDFKPTYGYVFEKFLAGFEFWGHGDIDLVFGRISKFINNDILKKYDTISVRHDYPSGFFMLYRNIPRVNELFKMSKDYKYVFSSDKHYCFDECNFQHGFLFNGIDISETNSSIESMMHVIKKAEKDNLLNPYFNFCIVEGVPGNMKWNKGILSLNNEYEILLYHFIQLKENQFFHKPSWKRIPDTFYIEKHGFFKSSRNNYKGSISRLFLNGRVGLRKLLKNTLMEINKATYEITPFFVNQPNVQPGEYKCRNKLMTLEKEGKKFYMSLSYPQYASMKLYPIFYNKSLLVSYDLNCILQQKIELIVLTRDSGQREIYHKKN